MLVAILDDPFQLAAATNSVVSADPTLSVANVPAAVPDENE